MNAYTSNKSRFRILKGGKISLVVSALLLNTSLLHAGSASLQSQTIDEKITTLPLGPLDDDTTIEITPSGIIEIINENDTSSSGSEIKGISGDSTTEYDLNITNNGMIDVQNIVSDSAFGIYLQNLGNPGTGSHISVTNDNKINVQAKSGHATGIQLQEGCDSALNVEVYNTGSIDANGSESYGIALGSIDSSSQIVENSGEITLQATSRAEGITATGNNSGTIKNSGSITVKSGTAIGIDADNYQDGTILNTGNIAVDGSASIGIKSDDNPGLIQNDGTITATKDNEYNSNAYSMYISGEDAAGRVVNNGTLNGNLIVKDNSFINNGVINLPYIDPDAASLIRRLPQDIPALVHDFTHEKDATLGISLYSDDIVGEDGQRVIEHSRLTTQHAVFKDGSIIKINVDADTTNQTKLIGRSLDDVVKLLDMKDTPTMDINLSKITIQDNSNELDFTPSLDENNNIDFEIVQGVAPTITATFEKGSVDVSTTINYTPAQGNSLKYMISNHSYDPALYANTPPQEAVAYSAGDNITGVEAGQYLLVYEVDSNGKVVGFFQQAIEQDQIYIAPVVSEDAPAPLLKSSIPDKLVDINDTQSFDLNVSQFFENAVEYGFKEIVEDNNITDWLNFNEASGVMSVKTGMDDNASLLEPGKYFIAIDASNNKDANATGYFTLRVKDLHAGLSSYVSKPSGATEQTGSDFLSVSKDDSNATVYENGSAKHEIKGVATATSQLPDSTVKLEDNGDVNTTTSSINENGEKIDFEVLAKTSGTVKARHSLKLADGNITKAISELANTNTTIKKDRTVETNATNANGNILQAKAKPDGTAEHSLNIGEQISKAISFIKGATTTLSAGGIDTDVTFKGTVYRISTDNEGKTVPKKGGKEIIDTTSGDKLAAGSTVTVKENGTMEINTTIPSNGLLKIKGDN